MLTFFTFTVIIVLFILYNTIVIVPMRSSYVIERLGKYQGVIGPGYHFLIPFFDRIAYRHEIREQIFDIPSQSCITKDNTKVEVDGLVYLKVMNPKRASYGIGNYKNASVNLAQTTMRSEIGKLTLSRIFSERDGLNEKIIKEIDAASDPWGIKVLRYEIKNIMPSKHVMTTLEKQMEAERQKRAEITLATADKESKIILSEGLRTEAINISEGEKQKRINEATGKAQEIELIAGANSLGVKLVAEAINAIGGNKAVKMQLIEQYIEQVGDIMETANISILPNEMANVRAIFEGAEKYAKPIKA